MSSKLCRLLLLSGLLGSSGCLQPWNYRFPTFWTRPPEVERQEYQYHDPFPDDQTGPRMGTRPYEYNDQRPLPINIREKYDGTRVRQPLEGTVPPPVGPSPGTEYPQVVPF